MKLTMTTSSPPLERGPPVRAFLFLAIGVLSVGAAAILVRLADAPALTACVVRLGLGGAILVVIAVVGARPFPSGKQAVRAVIAGVLLAVHFGLWIGSLSLTTVTASVVLVCLQPIFVAIGGALVFKERVSFRVGGGIGIALVGAIIVTTDTQANVIADGTALGNGMALAGAVAIAAYVLTVRGLRGDVLAHAAVITSSAAIVTVPAALFVGAPLWPTTSTSLLWLVALALGPQVIGHTALNAALRSLPAAVVSGSILLEPVIASSLAFVVLGEAAGGRTLGGGALTLIGVVILLRPRRNPPSGSAQKTS
jgi:drug/metabolite transporter (DMT)-like permease